MKHDVHIFAVVRLKAVDIDADTHVGAVGKAKKVFDDLYGLFEVSNIRRLPPGIEAIEFGEEFSHFLVDEAGDDEFEESTWHGPDGQPTERLSTMMRVRWEIDIDADSPVEAARAALAIQRRPESIATVFVVIDPNGHETTVDLQEEPTESGRM